MRRAVPRLALLGLLSAAWAFGAISGVAINRTTGQPAGRIAITLISFAQGMDPIEEVYTDAEGRFAFVKEVSGGPAMLRSEFEGVSYSKMVPPGTPQQGVEVDVYEAAKEPIRPTGRVLVLELSGAELIVNESYLFENKTSPPRTYRDAENGTLRFYLPAEAKGIVQVEASGPARMPLQQTADPTSKEGVYKVDFPIKPGENRVSLTYLVPHSDETAFHARSVYPKIQTRVAVPSGVEVSGEGLTSLGKEPNTQAEIFEVASGGDFEVTLKGSGRLGRGSSSGSEAAPSAGAGGGGGSEISIQPAPISKEAPLLFGIAGAILALGFVRLYLKGGAAPAEKTRGAAKRR
ncbi:MAG: hypothetical protein GC160_09195 [Acidobacteria bacterium]|nr:hypothetical protein [Acidobacteriota bacterium]